MSDRYECPDCGLESRDLSGQHATHCSIGGRPTVQGVVIELLEHIERLQNAEKIRRRGLHGFPAVEDWILSEDTSTRELVKALTTLAEELKVRHEDEEEE